MSIHTYVHQYSELLLLRCLREDLTIAGIQKRIEVVLARHLHVLDVLLERLRHRRGQPREEVDLESLLDRSHVGQPALRALLSGSLEKSCGQTEGGGLAFSGRSLGHGPSWLLRSRRYGSTAIRARQLRRTELVMERLWALGRLRSTTTKASNNEDTTRGGSRSEHRNPPGTVEAPKASPRRPGRQPMRARRAPMPYGTSGGWVPGCRRSWSR